MIARGKFSTVAFEKDVMSVMGGNFLVMPGDVLASDMTALDASTLTITGDETFAVNDQLRIKDGVDDEWLTVTNIGSAPTYTVTRDRDSSYGADSNPIWKKGTSVTNFGASGEGGIFMTASESNAPYMSIVTHAGSPWSTLTTHVRIGNLNGYLGYSSDLFGIAIGETNKYLKYDPTNGLRVKGDISVTGGSISGSFVVDTGGSVVSDDYVADTTGFILNSTGGLEVWTGTISGTIIEYPLYVSTTNLLYSLDTERRAGDTTDNYTKMKSILVYCRGQIRTSFALNPTEATTAYGKIYINGVAEGAEHSKGSEGYQTYTDDVDVVAGDTVELWVRNTGSYSDYKEFRLFGVMFFDTDQDSAV